MPADAVAVTVKGVINDTTGYSTPTTVDVAFALGSSTTHYKLTVPPQQEAYVKPSNTPITPTGMRFGRSVSIDGNTLVAGAPNESGSSSGINGNQTAGLSGSGAAYIYVRAGSTWTQQAYVKASNARVDAQFGVAVAVSGDTLVIGSPGESSNATGINGDQTNTSAAGAGAAYVFVRAMGRPGPNRPISRRPTPGPEPTSVAM